MTTTGKGDMGGSTSIKELFQGMTPEGASVIQGTVIAESPLKIQATNDKGLIMHEAILIVPRHLTDYVTTTDITLDKGTIDSRTHKDGAHPHGSSGQHGGHSGGDGAHSHPEDEGTHINRLETFNIYGATVKVRNALKVGEKVHLLSFNNGKKYYILDRVR
jgi:hypothetical protein